MGRVGRRPIRTVSEEWSPGLAYAIGLLATDGNLARTSPLIDLTSKDREQLRNFCTGIGRVIPIGEKRSGTGRVCYRVQLKNVLFYRFLLRLGLTPMKSKTLGKIRVPAKYFWDYLRGEYDGDGTTYAYYDTRWRSSYMVYTEFASASRDHIDWLRTEIESKLGIRGHVTQARGKSIFQLKYAKSDSVKILRRMYYADAVLCLPRKRLKVERILDTVPAKL